MLTLINLNPKKILIAILIITALFRLFRLDYPNKYVFDEVYHAFTAKEYLTLSPIPWEWWNTPPPGVAYEWTHPPLAKEIMALSMFLLNNQDGWAWRLPGALLGILSVYLVYLLGKKLFKKETISLVSAFIFSMDGLNFVQSRTGMNDIYYITFFLISLFFLLNKKFVFSAVFLGLALASKWAAIYSYLIFVPILLVNKEYFKLFYFLIIPPIIYLISYLPFFLLGHNTSQFIGLQQQIWWYHTNLKATHAYTSPWWSWPFNLYPVWYFVEYFKDSMANIFAAGNPVVFWFGSIAVLATIWEVVKKRSLNLFIILIGFFAFWLPWALSPRIMFLYHFSPSVPFLSLALGRQISLLLERKERRELALAVMGIILIGFFLIFPFLTAVPLPRDFIKIFFLFNLSKNPF